MTSLLGPAKTPWYFLIGAGAVMVYALCTSKKAHAVIKTSVDLSRQDEGEEAFGSTPIARTVVRISMTLANGISRIMPDGSKNGLTPASAKTKQSLPTELLSTLSALLSTWYWPVCSSPWEPP